MNSFTDSPEDLVSRARSVSASGRIRVDEQTTEPVPPAACRLISDLGRFLETERSTRASSFASVRETNIGYARVETSLRRAKRVNRVLGVIVVALLLVDVVMAVHGGVR